MAVSGASLLGRLESIRAVFGPEAAAEKERLVRHLAGRRLASAGEVERLHETLLFLSAFPDCASLRSACDEALAGFAGRADLRRFLRALADTGIAGTRTTYSFSFPMARWLAARSPGDARIDWPAWERKDDLDDLLPSLVAPAEVPGVDDETISIEEWVRGATAPGAGDYATLVRRFERLRTSPDLREHLFNQLDVPVGWEAGDATGSRTLSRWPVSRLHEQSRPLDRSRPRLRQAIREPLRLRPVDRRSGERLIRLAREAMAVRHRELEAFDYADARDAWLANAGRGLLMSIVGVRPERRLLPEALYSGLFLRNGVPIGYWLASALFGSSEVAYNVFPVARQGETAWMYGRLLAMLHQFLGSTDFTVFRYQFGHENPEAIASGAFWFYQKLGFRPRGRELRRLMRRELARMKKDRSYRSPPATLRRLALENLFFHMGKPRDDVIGLFPYANLGHQVTRDLASRSASPATASREALGEAKDLLGVRRLAAWSRDERRAFEAWAPVVTLLPGLARWTSPQRRLLVRLLRAKGGRREVDFVRLADAHRRFRGALQRLCLSWEE